MTERTGREIEERENHGVITVFRALCTKLTRRNEPTTKGTIIFDANSTITLSPMNFQKMITSSVRRLLVQLELGCQLYKADDPSFRFDPFHDAACFDILI
ncbi:hypothetical protein K1719_041520 [Acacia pycnantha]|nr:hypothetical protein K1719_041520 [Acacia pycnantha]